jgi:hypothetical protein
MSAYIKANILNFKKFNDAAQGLWKTNSISWEIKKE